MPTHAYGTQGFEELCRRLESGYPGFERVRVLVWDGLGEELEYPATAEQPHVVFPSCTRLDLGWRTVHAGPHFKWAGRFPAVKMLRLIYPPFGCLGWLRLSPQLDTLRIRSFDVAWMEDASMLFAACATWLVQLEIGLEGMPEAALTDHDIRSLGALRGSLRRLALLHLRCWPSEAELGRLLPRLRFLEVRGRVRPPVGQTTAWNPLNSPLPGLVQLRLVDAPGQGHWEFPPPALKQAYTPSLQMFKLSQPANLDARELHSLDCIWASVRMRGGIWMARDNKVDESECWLATSRLFALWEEEKRRAAATTRQKSAKGYPRPRRKRLIVPPTTNRSL